MKITIGAYEVKISAVNVYNGDIVTKEFLNRMAIAFAEEATKHEFDGCVAIAKEANKMREDIYDYLDGKGYYDEVK